MSQGITVSPATEVGKRGIRVLAFNMHGVWIYSLFTPCMQTIPMRIPTIEYFPLEAIHGSYTERVKGDQLTLCQVQN